MDFLKEEFENWKEWSFGYFAHVWMEWQQMLGNENRGAKAKQIRKMHMWNVPQSLYNLRDIIANYFTYKVSRTLANLPPAAWCLRSAKGHQGSNCEHSPDYYINRENPNSEEPN